MRYPAPHLLILGLALAVFPAGCTSMPGASAPQVLSSDPTSLPPAGLAPGERLSVAATTSIVADAVAAVGGEAIELQTLIPAGVDPHAFEPTPQDLVRSANAEVVFLNGYGLDDRLAQMLASASVQAPRVSLSVGVPPLTLSQEDTAGGNPSEIDPHTWLDPNNILVWAENAATALSALDPGNADGYAARASAYAAELRALDAEIRQALAAIPSQDRRLVTDHDEFGYFARRYGFTIVGAVIPGFSTETEPSPQELASLEQAIRDQHVPAIFVSSVVMPVLAERVAEDTGTRLVTLYAHSLTAADGPAPDYLSLMRYNVAAIVTALTPQAASAAGIP